MYYYFLGSALPDLHIGSPPEIGVNELLNLLKDNLTDEDYEKVEVIRRFYDIQNMRSLWKKEEWDKWGNLSQNELEDAILTQSHLAGLPYIEDFLQRYDKKEDRLAQFPRLISDYYKEELTGAQGFLLNFLSFERELRLVLTAFRAKKLGRDVLKELQYEDPNDPLVAQIIAQKESTHYEPPEEYSHLKPLFEKYYDEPFELYQALSVYQFEKIDEMVGIDRFSIKAILGYVVKYILVDKWLELDKKKGLQIVDAIVKENL